MEEQTAKSDARNGLQNDIPRLQSMLAKLNLIHKHPKTDNVKLHPGTACKSMFYHSLEPVEGIKNEENRKESTVRSGDEEQPTRSSETKDGNEAVEEVKELPEAFPKWERKSILPDCLSIEIQMGKLGRQPRESESLEDKKSKEMEEHVAGAALLPNNQYQEMSAHTSYLSVSSDKVDSAQMGLKHEPDEACGPSKQYVSMDTSRVLTHQTAVNVTGKTTRSTSDPVTQESSKSFNPIKEERPLSAPSISNLREYEKYEDFANAMPAKSFSKAAKILGQGYSGMSIGNVEHDNSLTKTQKKGVKNKMKNLTQKLMEKLKDKHDCEHAGRRSTQDSMEEEEGQKLNSMEVEAEDQDIPPPLPPKMGKYVFLERTFTLKDFKLNLEPINLMEEIFTGSEWLSYLPIKESPAEKETSDQSMTNDVLRPEKDIQLDVPPPTAEQDQSEDIKTPEEDQPEDVKTPEEDQPEDVKVNQDSASDPQEDNVAKVKSDLDVKQVEWDANIFAIPKALLTNNARQKRSCESNKSDDVYDCVDMYIIPKNDFPLMKRKASDALLDFSAVKSFELLDNSALKSRIRLSKKRHHRSPKKHKKVKTEMLSGIFYKIPMVILNESPVSTSPPCHSIPFSMSPPLHLPSRPYHS